MRVLAGGEDRAGIVRGMAQPAAREVAVHEIDIADESRIVERRVDEIGAATSDQRATAAGTTELLSLCAARLDRRRAEGIDGARHCIEDADLESLAPLDSKIFVLRPQREPCDAIGLTRA